MNDGRQKSLIMPQQKKIIYEHYTIVMWSHHFVVAFAARSVSLLLLFDGSNVISMLLSFQSLFWSRWADFVDMFMIDLFCQQAHERHVFLATGITYSPNSRQRQKYIITFYFDFWQKCWSIIQMLLMPTMKPNSSDKSEKFVRSFCHFRANCQMGKKVQAQKKAAHTLTSKSISNGWRAAGLTAAT